jgi:GNAT superfamily N-acetyltransferase
LYCQNLSLFAKLFLDNKSVFFDVTGFLYFLLVHTDCATGEQQVIGFFSKEKMSWDNNNLACILVFPPWQRKGLGSLLVAVSYEISRREQVMGGPEKPISDLGKMGYIRYWSGEVARYLLSVKETDRKKGRGMVTLEDISQGTWVCVDDCLAALRAMDVAVAAGKGKGETPRVRIDKEVVKQWAERTRTPLVPIIDPKGFLEGYGFKETVDEEMGE